MSSNNRLRIELIIFDLDGTLIDSRRDIAVSANFALRQVGRPELPLDVITAYVGDGVQTLMDRALGPAPPTLAGEAVRWFRQHYREHLLDATVLYPDVREVLEYFAGKRKAVASNKPRDFAVRIAEGLGIAGHFDLILGGDSVPHKKPDPEPARKIMTALGLPADRTLIVGDCPVDVIMARRAGGKACAVTYGFRPRAELEAERPDLLIDRLADLETLII